MSRAHRTVRRLALVSAIPLAIFIITVINGLFPLTTRRLWITTMESIRVAGLWLIYDVIGALPPLVFVLGILAICGVFALGFVLAFVDWLRGLLF